MKFKNYIFASLAVLLFVSTLLVLAPARSSAITTQTGGDGFVPFLYQGKIYNIFHHQSPSGNPAAPKYDLDCTLPSGQICPTYPRYFSSDAGSSGALGIGTPGTSDIYTSAQPNATIVGSRLYYAAAQATTNGIGCYDLNTLTNCGYFQLGTLVLRTGFIGLVFPSKVDGIEQVGNKLYSIGDDMNMYCLDVSIPASPVACTGQPFAVNTGITGQMPTSVQSMAARLIHNGKIYLSVNYNNNTPAADTRITCYDPGTDSRCAGWTSLDHTGTSADTTYTLFDFPDTTGALNAFCSPLRAGNPVLCWDYNSQSPVSAPPGIFDGITSNLPVLVRNSARVGNKTYFALEDQSFTAQDGLGVCYDFTTQARCAGFGINGVKRWDGSDGDMAVNGGVTREYGYTAYNANCILGLGDAGVLWSFNAHTGKTLASLDCADDVAAVVPAAPDTGSSNALSVMVVAGIFLIFAGAFGLRRTAKIYR